MNNPSYVAAQVQSDTVLLQEASRPRETQATVAQPGEPKPGEPKPGEFTPDLLFAFVGFLVCFGVIVWLIGARP